jgi:hypothetical protein
MSRSGSECSNNYSFSEKTLSLLRQAQWDTDRVVDVREYAQILQNKGITVFPVAHAFLRRYGGLTITDHIGQTRHEIAFGGMQAARDTELEVIGAFAARIGRSLCPIGVAWASILMMTPEGHVYSGNGQTTGLIFWGETGEHAIENMLTGKDFPDEY